MTYEEKCEEAEGNEWRRTSSCSYPQFPYKEEREFLLSSTQPCVERFITCAQSYMKFMLAFVYLRYIFSCLTNSDCTWHSNECSTIWSCVLVWGVSNLIYSKRNVTFPDSIRNSWLDSLWITSDIVSATTLLIVDYDSFCKVLYLLSAT